MSTRRARVKVKNAPATTRVQAAAEFGRKKARQRRQQSHRRYLLIGGGVLAVSLFVAGGLMSYNGALARAATTTQDRFWNATADAGFRLDQVTLTGREHADVKTVTDALAIKQGAPILAISLADLKDRLSKVAEIKSVRVTRALPNRIDIAITERIPAAFWQTDGRLQLIDREGVVLSREHYREKLTLPVVVGADVPTHMEELLAILDAVPSLKPDVAAAVRVGGRRWNMELTRNIVILLPEEEPVAAWKKFAGLVETKALLSKSIRSVDMRMEDRVFIQPTEEKANPIIFTNARDI